MLSQSLTLQGTGHRAGAVELPNPRYSLRPSYLSSLSQPPLPSHNHNHRAQPTLVLAPPELRGAPCPCSPLPRTTATMSIFPRSNPPALLNQFLQVISDARAARDPLIVSSCLSADPIYCVHNDLMISLRGELLQNPRAIKPTTERILGDEWPGFTELVISYLKYVAALDPAVLYDISTMGIWFKNLRVYMRYAPIRRSLTTSADGTAFAAL